MSMDILENFFTALSERLEEKGVKLEELKHGDDDIRSATTSPEEVRQNREKYRNKKLTDYLKENE